jgi:hypothetical protein
MTTRSNCCSISKIEIIQTKFEVFCLPPPLLLEDDDEAFRRRTVREQLKHRLAIFYKINENKFYYD